MSSEYCNRKTANQRATKRKNNEKLIILYLVYRLGEKYTLKIQTNGYSERGNPSITLSNGRTLSSQPRRNISYFRGCIGNKIR